MDKYTATEEAYKNGYEDGIKAFALRLKKYKIRPEFPWDDFVVCETTIDDLVKEMTKVREQS